MQNQQAVTANFSSKKPFWFAEQISAVTTAATTQANTKHKYNICTTSAQRLRRWADVVQMSYKCFMFTTKITRKRLANDGVRTAASSIEWCAWRTDVEAASSFKVEPQIIEEGHVCNALVAGSDEGSDAGSYNYTTGHSSSMSNNNCPPFAPGRIQTCCY